MKTPHKHAELIKAWADGAEIQFYDVLTGSWKDCKGEIFLWHPTSEYRIKPEPKPDLVTSVKTVRHGSCIVWNSEKHTVADANLRLTFDGETGKLKSAEVL